MTALGGLPEDHHKSEASPRSSTYVHPSDRSANHTTLAVVFSADHYAATTHPRRHGFQRHRAQRTTRQRRPRASVLLPPAAQRQRPLSRAQPCLLLQEDAGSAIHPAHWRGVLLRGHHWSSRKEPHLPGRVVGLLPHRSLSVRFQSARAANSVAE
ncbi:hypothetical protein EJ03DRAFT_134167 [Teratosphaeria nubilosa]|uniref:Uncharacterized protein n=1 Tax=Teratosphaeria nubilosa TaxID=161662 RepID=A0A6G1L7F4_9PEZI|nr:hypothetical protein EJ03DRAFT_134167 [Teratosphaeria nubilosa]